MARHSHSIGTDSAGRSDLNALQLPSLVAGIPGQARDNWVGGNGGNGDWNTGSDWSSGSVPAMTALANFALGGELYTVTGDATIGAIEVDADAVTFDGALSQAASVASTFLTAVNGATVTLDANSSVFANGGLDFTDGTLLDVQGSLTLLTGGGSADQIIVEGLSGSMVTGSALTVNGLYVQTGGSFTGDVTLNDGGNITVDSSSLFGANTITLLGSGTIYESLATGSDAANVGVAAAIAVGASNTVTLASDPGVNFLVGGVIGGDGGVLVNNGSVELGGVNTFTGGLVVQNASLIVDGQGGAAGNVIYITDGTLVTQPDSTSAVDFTDTVVASGSGDTIDATAGNLLVFAGPAGSLNFIGGAGSDTVVGDQGALSVAGGSAGDLVFGGVGALDFTGGAAASTVVGGAGAVTATGGSGGDLIYGGTSGHDMLYTGTGPATLVGGSGAQLFATGSSNSVLVDGGGAVLNATASSGNDTLFGGQTGSSDTIFSGAGTSTAVLNGGTTEFFTTGTADVFAGSGTLTLAYVSGFGGGFTNVQGFNVAQDAISLSGYAQGTAAQILANETITGGSTVLQIPNGGDQIVLFGVTGLMASNFT